MISAIFEARRRCYPNFFV